MIHGMNHFTIVADDRDATLGFYCGLLGLVEEQWTSKIDMPDDIAVLETNVRSHDGTLVPLSIVHKRGLALDGHHPTLLWGYAAYGDTEEPWFSAWRLAWPSLALESGPVTGHGQLF